MTQVKKNMMKYADKRPTISGAQLPTNDDNRVTIGLRKQTVETTSSLYFKP